MHAFQAYMFDLIAKRMHFLPPQVAGVKVRVRLRVSSERSERAANFQSK